MLRGPAHPRSLSYRGEDEQGARRCPRRGIAPHGARRPSAPLLRKSRWLLLKREENLKTEQRFRLRDLLRYNLKTVRAYLLKEAFQQLWDYNSPTWAGKFLDEWCRQVMRSRIEPMKKIARSLREHRELILNYFRAQKLLSSGVVEGLNNKAKVTMRKSYGFRTFLFWPLSDLNQEELSHETRQPAVYGKTSAYLLACDAVPSQASYDHALNINDVASPGLRQIC